jgi:hypothetical protein
MRHPLRERELPLSCDVALAISSLVGDRNNLPIAINRAQIIDKLIEMAHEEDDGTIGHISRIARRAMTDSFYNRLTNTAVFQAGYKQYEKNAENPVVPITDFFFKNVFANGDVVDCLDAMSDFEIRQSLPKRMSPMLQSDGNDVIRDDRGDVIRSGEIAGIVILPPNSRVNLLAVWLKRRANSTIGQLKSTVTSIKHAKPEAPAVEKLEEMVNPVPRVMHQALPKPRREREEES